jgi:hypothetical protein
LLQVTLCQFARQSAIASANSAFLFLLKNNFEKYDNTYTNVSYRTTDIISLIENNTVTNKRSFLNDIIKADIITMSVGLNDFITYPKNKMLILDNEIYEIVNDYDNLFSLLRKYSKENIYLIGIYNPNLSSEYEKQLEGLNEIIKRNCLKYKIIYVDIFNDMKSNEYLNSESIYPTTSGYEMIGDKIIKDLNNK